mgnify:CR=1 FL=1
MGGSFALAMRQAQLAHKVVGYSPSERSRHLALELGVVDQAFDQLPLAIQGSDLVLVAVPVSHMRATFAAIAPHLSDNALVMDVGSTKSDVIEAAEQGLGHKLKQWLPCHPIAGKEKAGVDQAEASLYQNRPLILTPLGVNSPAQIKRATALWQALGSRVHLMDPNAHDQAFAAVSHLPHLLAFAYINGIAGQPRADDYLALAGPGFRDFSRIAAGDPQVWREQLRSIAQSQARASHLIDQLLALALAQEAREVLQPQALRLDEVVRETLLRHLPRADQLGVDLGARGLDAPVSVRAQRALLEGVLDNLIDNALRYGRPAGDTPPRVTVDIAPTAEGGWRLSVLDNGPGLAAGERERLLTRWAQGQAGEALGQGSGLGLAIVQEIARQHQASVSIEDTRPGQASPGACFTVRFAATRS